jgi:hypothetical protein
MRSKKGNYTIMKTEKQLQEQVESQDQEPNAIADHELRFITGGSDKNGRIGTTVRIPGAGTPSVSSDEAIRRAFSKK